MTKHKEYELVKNRFILGELSEFRDIFRHLPKSRVAEDLGIGKARFTGYIENPDGFAIRKLMEFAKDCDLSIIDLGQMIETQQPVITKSDSPRKGTYKAIGLKIKNGEIHTLGDFLDRVADYKIAEDLGRKADTIKRFLDQVENFQVKDLRTLASLCEVSLLTMFKLVEAQYVIQLHKQT